MTERTKVLGIRLSSEDKDFISKYLNRESVEHIIWQIKHGEIEITPKGVVIKRVNKISENVNTFEKSVNTLESDPDGEWVREMAHVLNVDVKTFKKKIEQNIYR